MSVLAGIDGGSVSIKIALLDEAGAVLHAAYRRHGGRPLRVAAQLLAEALAARPDARLVTTGSTGQLLAKALGAPHLNEISCLAAATARLHPEVATIFEMGGEDAKLICLEGGTIRDFALNSVCAAGTGSFLDQQAERMRLSIEEFARLALACEHPPQVAGRCSVFAKSDMIHLQQIATPVADIIAGLSFAVARNFKGAIVRGRPTPSPVAFMGGVALNAAVVRAFGEVFGLSELLLPERPCHMGAIGAVLLAHQKDLGLQLDLDAPARLEAAAADQGRPNGGRAPLVSPGDGFAQRHLRPGGAEQERSEAGELYMGIDVGSISTNLAVIDPAGRLLARRYLRTASRPIEAVRQGLAEIGAELAETHPGAKILGVGTTGSGRYMIADFTGADVVKNEITAQARAAVHIDPSVDTIFEIGGQDSKFIALKDGVIVDFEMNKACAAGTGSFLEEQAEKLSVAIKDEFASRALSARQPCRLGERCTVFMENSLMASLERGADKDDLLAGLAYSIVENYLGRVVGAKHVGSRIFFQGGTAFNHAVTAAFEKHLGRTITVPPDHDVTGAIGMALIARDWQASASRPSTFRGFDLARVGYRQSSFACQGCENACEINKVVIDGVDKPLLYGGRCEKYDVARRKDHGLPDLFAYREEELTRAQRAARERHAAGRPAPRGAVGLPMAFFMHDFLPYFATLLWELGFDVVTSPRTSRSVARLGAEMSPADTCFPVKAALGHVKSLLNQGLTRLFVPSVINLAGPEDRLPSSLACPLTQSFPYQVRAVAPEATLIAPSVDLVHGQGALTAELRAALKPFGVGRGELKRAMRAAAAAQEAFSEAIRAKGREVLAGLTGRAVVVIGRAYNAFDAGLNLDLPAKLANLGELAIPMDFLEVADVSRDWPEMYWRSGQRILGAVRALQSDPRLHPLLIGSFSCGPDSFIHHFLARELAGRPALLLEIDEHSADAGCITRCEAFLDSLDGLAARGQSPARAEPLRPAPRRSREFAAERTVYVPRMSDHACALAAAFRACGVAAEVLPETDAAAVELARRFVSGKECYPCAVTTGDMLHKAMAPDFDPGRAAFFMPSGTGPCRFGQYNVLQRQILDRAGFPEVPIFSPVQNERLYQQLGIVGSDFSRLAWDGVVAFDLLTKCLHRTRPGETAPGTSDALYARWRDRLTAAIAGREPGLPGLTRAMREEFAAVSVNGHDKPLIGIVGEIFVRSNRFSNEDLVARIEALGGRAWLAPVDEWVFYVGAMGRRRALKRHDLPAVVRLLLTQRIQTRRLHALERGVHGFLPTIPEPATAAILRKAAPYVRDTFEGEAVLSVGKAVDLCERGVAGLVNAMPFGCMPGTVAAALLRTIAKRFDVPLITLPFDGTASPTLRLTLETFMEQARARRRA
jgi:predicted CoA-substrate-specific enzyme activase